MDRSQSRLGATSSATPGPYNPYPPRHDPHCTATLDRNDSLFVNVNLLDRHSDIGSAVAHRGIRKIPAIGAG
jgi:hypothetical protein